MLQIDLSNIVEVKMSAFVELKDVTKIYQMGEDHLMIQFFLLL